MTSESDHSIIDSPPKQVRRRLSRLLCVLLPLFCALPLRAQQSILKFDRISSEQGLSDNYVICMLQDRQGLIWFGTRDGLNRYDGTVFTTYRPDLHDPGSISDGGVECLMEDREGRLWMGTRDGGLDRFERASGRFVHFLHNPADPGTITAGPITSICEQGGYVWITTGGPDLKLCRLDKVTGRAIRYRHSPEDISSISSDRVSGVVCDRFGTLWVGTEDAGLNRFDPASGGFINGYRNRLYAASSTGEITRLSADAAGTLWFWSGNQVRWLDHPSEDAGDRAATTGSMTGLRITRIYALHRDLSGRIWVGGANGGVGVMRAGEKEVLYAVHNGYDPYSLGSDRIYCIMEDRSGNIWLGTDNGVSKFNRCNWHVQYYQHDPLDSGGISAGVVRNILKDRDGDLWFAMQGGGVNRIAPSNGAITRYLSDPHNPSSLNDNTVNVIIQDADGDLWFGTNAGLARFDRKRGAFRRYHCGSPGMERPGQDNVWSLLVDRKGTLWIGTFGGLYSLDRTTNRVSPHPLSGAGSRETDRILCLYEDRGGTIWAGTDNGLRVLERATGSWRHYLHAPGDTFSLGNNRVWYIHEDRDGIFWLATSGGGMNRFDPRLGRFDHYTEKEGLAGNIACGIMEDDRGRLWVSTTKGLSVFDRSTRRFRTYALQDGFYVHEFHFKSCFEDNRGYFYFGGADGVIAFHPDSIDYNHQVPGVMLTSVKVFDHERIVDATGWGGAEIRFDHDSNFFSFKFAALDFTNARRNQYRYRLEGLDDRWRETDGEHPYADYTDVPPGRYTFHLLGSNSDGVWNERGVSVSVNVQPAYWQTWWFAGLVIFLVGALIAAAVMMRIRGIRHRGMLERKLVEYQLKALRAQMNPHFIFNSLNSILLFMLEHDTDAAHLYLTKFSRLMRSTLEHSKNESVPLAEELSALRCYLDLETLRLDNRFIYSIDVAPEVNIDDVMIPPMLIQPYAENAIQHGLKRSGGILTIDIRRESEWILCSVTDNGVGRGEGTRGGGSSHRSRGMSVTKERLEVLSSLNREHYGLEVVDLTGETGLPLGTRVNIRIPISVHFHQAEFTMGRDS